ncbi:MAG TPA: hypothetical protein VJ826_00730 [Candidatus Polarisedimenticolaceae bacterium]|nr:hypothetical protein [Candidatus Polarisedimenticolaceae bacterium]
MSASAECDVYHLANYKLGMTQDDAVAVRGGTIRGKELRPDVAWPDKSWVYFDGQKKVRAVYFWGSGGSVSARNRIIEQLGRPTDDNVRRAPTMYEFVPKRVTSTRWDSADCGADVVLTVEDKSGAWHLFLLPHGIGFRSE